MGTRKGRFLRGSGGLLAILLTAEARGEDITYYVPLVSVLSQTIQGQPGPTYVYWSSSATVFNSGPKPAMLHVTGTYGPGLWIAFPPPCRNILLDSNMGGDLGGCVFGAPYVGGYGFIEVTAEPSILVFANVNRVVDVPGCGLGGGPPEWLIYTAVPQGSAPLPVFRGFFPANSTVVAGPVDLGSLDHPGTCITGPMAHRRRVNVTLFNAGLAEARVTLVARRSYAFSYPIYEETVTVPLLEVRQLNSVPIPLASYPPDHVGYDERAWLSITSTQPFLAYVSTIFEGGEPGSNAVTILEPKLSN
ncbi:MAG TPA: hypothetical protein VGM13_13055 [Thermoanaerobaculia bacterium]|jgi:hypothetical protein